MQVTCIKCNKLETLGINQSTSNGHIYKYYMIQYYNPKTKKHSWCYIAKEESLPEQYQLIIHKEPQLSTTYPQTTNTLNYRINHQNIGDSLRGCRLAWSRLRDSGSRDSGPNPGSPTNPFLEKY